MSLKLKNPNDLFYNDPFCIKTEAYDPMEEKSESKVGPIKKKRSPACLSIVCPVCGGPAPDHVHFGGKYFENLKKYLKSGAQNNFVSLKASVATPVGHFLEEPLSNLCQPSDAGKKYF